MSDLATRWRSLQGTGLFAYARAVSLTARFRIEGWDYFEEAKQSPRPILWSLWHGQFMGFIALADRRLDPRQFTAVTVGDERGDTLGMLARRLGGTPHRVDMSGNPVAAGRAVLRVIQAMQAGKQSIIAPDGPDGPAYTPKDGVAYLARKAGANILPLGVFTKSAFFLDRWDSYLLPLPFSRFHVVIGPPIAVGRKDDLQDVLQRVSIALHDVRDRAQVLAGMRPWR